MIELEGLTGVMRLDGHWLDIGDELHFLRQREMEVMRFFMKHPNKVYSTTQIMGSVWGLGYCRSNVQVQIKGLREKIEEDHTKPRMLRATGLGAWSSGYVLITDPRKEAALDKLYLRNGRRRE